jgi:ubiquinone/menaquinone biosynthesis C-methylase UbiE
MKMSRFEKKFVNRPQKSQNNIYRIKEQLTELPVEHVHRVLEIGCGIGMVSAFLATECGMQVYGTDFDPEEIEAAKQLNPGCENLIFQVEDASKLSFSDGYFDLVISQNVFHHIPDWQNAVREIARVLHKDGYVIWLDIVFPNWLKNMVRPLLKNYGVYTKSDVLAAFEAAGLITLAEKSIVHGPFKHAEQILQKAA